MKLRLIPEGMHLDGESDVPNVQASLYSVSKLFATAGENPDYYLNEKRSFTKFANSLGFYNVSPLPSFSGSRQGINVTLPRKVASNNFLYLLYLDQNRVDGQTNELVASVHRDQRDFLNLAAYSARSLIGVVIHDPLVFFIHCEESTRPMIRTIMDCADQTIQLFGGLDIIGMKDPPVIDILSQKVLAALPRLKRHTIAGGWRRKLN